jgi:hypothetical protein
VSAVAGRPLHLHLSPSPKLGTLPNVNTN